MLSIQNIMEYAKPSTPGEQAHLFELNSTSDLYVVDLEFAVRIVHSEWSRAFRILFVSVVDVLCAVEFVLAIVAILETSATVSAENLGAAVIDIACMIQITSHVHACITKREAVLPPLISLLQVARTMQECCNVVARRRMYRIVYVIRAITAGIFIAIALCLIICVVLNRPESQNTPVATWPAPGPDMPVTIFIVSALQLYATVSGSVLFCIACSIHLGSVLYAVALFSGLRSCLRCLHLFSEEIRAVSDMNENCKYLLFTRVCATFAILVYTGMSIALGYVTMRVLWMTAFGFLTLFHLTLTGQYLTESAEKVSEALYDTLWYVEGSRYRNIMYIALLRTTKPLYMSTWLCKDCDLPYLRVFVRKWYSSVQMMYNARVSKNVL